MRTPGISINCLNGPDHRDYGRVYMFCKKNAMESCLFEVLNKVYLQKILHGWAVNRETNLMSLLNP